MSRSLGIGMCLLISFLMSAQESFTISGKLTDASTGEALIGANIFITKSGQGVVSNNYGFYSITLPHLDSVGLVFSFLGYQPQIKKVYLSEDINLNVQMEPATTALEEVVVTADANEALNRPQMSIVDIPTAKIKELPAILGEKDVLKVVQLLPGVQAGNEGTTGFHVRGGNADQNLVQLDEAVVYNPNHLFGLFSSFNTRAINSATLIKGGFPAQYGGRLSSILDITMREGNKKRFSGQGGVGLITSQLTLEGPLKHDEASFILSGRRTYFDWLVRPFLPKSVKTNYIFYDLNAKLNWQLGPKDHFYLSAFRGNDDAFFSQDGIEYNVFFNNQTATLRWNRVFGQKVFLNSSFVFNQYDQNISALQDNAFSKVLTGIQDYSGKIELQFFPNPDHVIRLGAQYLNHRFQSSGDSRVKAGASPNPEISLDSIPVKFFDEFAVYFNDEIRLNQSFSANIGIRIPAFLSNQTKYYRVEPRASLNFKIDNTTSIKASYSLMNQFIHQIPSSTASVPIDIWIPSTRKTRPQRSEQVALGAFKNHPRGFEASLELYHKTMDHQVLFQEGNQLIRSLDVDQLLTYGRGWSYGAEFLLGKKAGRATGWVSYTLSWTKQKFEDLNFGRTFPFRYDRRHNLSIATNYDLNEKWSISGTFVYTSGSHYTVPSGRTHVVNGGSLFEGNYFIYENRNNAQLNPYHRLNLSFTYKRPSKFFGHPYDAEIVFSFYNLYSRQNPYFIYFQVDPKTSRPQAKQVSLLPILPSVNYNFKF